MQHLRNAILVLALTAAAATPVMADETLTVVADSTLAGQAGFVVHSVYGDNTGESIFLTEESGKIRFYATREFGFSSWDIVASAQYLVPTSTLTIGDTWDYINTDNDEATVARVGAEESVETAAGTFSCYRVDIERVAAPGTAYETMWFAAGVGFVRNQGFLNGSMDWRDELQSHAIAGGTGFMPLAAGNSWNYVEVPVATVITNWGELKSTYR